MNWAAMCGQALSISVTRSIRIALRTCGLSSSRSTNRTMKRRSSPSRPVSFCSTAARRLSDSTLIETWSGSGGAMCQRIVSGSTSSIVSRSGSSTSASKRITSTPRSRWKVTLTGRLTW